MSHPEYREVMGQCGVNNLARRLNALLVEHIRSLLPGLRRAVNDALEVSEPLPGLLMMSPSCNCVLATQSLCHELQQGLPAPEGMIVARKAASASRP
jgi:hypothetical protein